MKSLGLTTAIKSVTHVLFVRYLWGTKENAYEDKKPDFSAARNNKDWGHCEMEFHNATTATVNVIRVRLI